MTNGCGWLSVCILFARPPRLLSSRSGFEAQIRVFEQLLAEPTLRQKVVSIHSRGADCEVIDRLEQARLPAILHWYTGVLKLA